MKDILRTVCATSALLLAWAALPEAGAAEFRFEITTKDRRIPMTTINGGVQIDTGYVPTVFTTSVRVVPGTSTNEDTSGSVYTTRKIEGSAEHLQSSYTAEALAISNLDNVTSTVRATQSFWTDDPSYYDVFSLVFLTVVSSEVDLGGGIFERRHFSETIYAYCTRCSYLGESLDSLSSLDYDIIADILAVADARIDWSVTGESYLWDSSARSIVAGSFEYLQYNGRGTYLGPVPEPSAIAMFGIGLLGMSFASRRLTRRG